MSNLNLNCWKFKISALKYHSVEELSSISHRCLNPGTYAKHLERWLDYFSASQLLIIDGEQLRIDPVLVMNNLQKFLEIEPFYNYTEHLR